MFEDTSSPPALIRRDCSCQDPDGRHWVYTRYDAEDLDEVVPQSEPTDCESVYRSPSELGFTSTQTSQRGMSETITIRTAVNMQPRRISGGMAESGLIDLSVPAQRRVLLDRIDPCLSIP